MLAALALPTATLLLMLLLISATTAQNARFDGSCAATVPTYTGTPEMVLPHKSRHSLISPLVLRDQSIPLLMIKLGFELGRGHVI
ncbi:hypothetical protein R80B4_00197 [Fibrobacteres bacterium R8-0-B4]